MLPADIGRELLEGMLGADHLGFLSVRWADAFLRCCEVFLRAPVNWGTRTVEHGGRVIRVGVHGLGADAQGCGSGPPPKMWRAGGNGCGNGSATAS